MNKLLLYIMLLISVSLTAMHLQKCTYDQINTNMLKSLLNLHHATKKIPEKEIVSLVSAGADPNIKADCGFTNNFNWLLVLINFHAGESGNLISFLLHNGADANTAGDSDCILMHACGLGNFAIASMLIAAGAQVRARNHKGYTVLSSAIGDPKYPGLYRNSIIQLLLEKGAAADIHATSYNGVSPFSLAKENGLHDILELFEKYKSIAP